MKCDGKQSCVNLKHIQNMASLFLGFLFPSFKTRQIQILCQKTSKFWVLSVLTPRGANWVSWRGLGSWEKVLGRNFVFVLFQLSLKTLGARATPPQQPTLFSRSPLGQISSKLSAAVATKDFANTFHNCHAASIITRNLKATIHCCSKRVDPEFSFNAFLAKEKQLLPNHDKISKLAIW